VWGEAGEALSREEEGRGPLVDVDPELSASGGQGSRHELARCTEKKGRSALDLEEFRAKVVKASTVRREGRRRPAAASSSSPVKTAMAVVLWRSKTKKKRERWLRKSTNWRRQRLPYSAKEVTGTAQRRWRGRPCAGGRRRSKNLVLANDRWVHEG
jgi:hypothetical protein